MKESDMERVAEWRHLAGVNREDTTKLDSLHKEVVTFCQDFPLPSDV